MDYIEGKPIPHLPYKAATLDALARDETVSSVVESETNSTRVLHKSFIHRNDRWYYPKLFPIDPDTGELKASFCYTSFKEFPDSERYGSAPRFLDFSRHIILFDFNHNLWTTQCLLTIP